MQRLDDSFRRIRLSHALHRLVVDIDAGILGPDREHCQGEKENLYDER